jgi:hypothetical protein
MDYLNDIPLLGVKKSFVRKTAQLIFVHSFFVTVSGKYSALTSKVNAGQLKINN